MSKHLVLMRDLITQHHPEFLNNPSLTAYALQRPDLFNVERLVEEALAHVGGYEFLDADGYDFSDYSDSKTATVADYDRVLAIGSVECKIGALRITAYNPHKDSLDYFFLPKTAVARHREVSYGKSEHKQRLRATWNEAQDHYNKFERYRVRTFEALAQAK